MAVTMTSEALGKKPGEPYEGPEEAWLLAQGYAKRTNYTGPGVSNTGPADTTPDNDVTKAENREPAPGYDTGHGLSRPNPDPVSYDFDEGGVNDDALGVFTVTPSELPLEGGKVVIAGTNLDGSTGVLFGDVAGVGLKVVSSKKIEVTAPAHATGGVSVGVTVENPAGNRTQESALDYLAAPDPEA